MSGGAATFHPTQTPSPETIHHHAVAKNYTEGSRCKRRRRRRRTGHKVVVISSATSATFQCSFFHSQKIHYIIKVWVEEESRRKN